MKSAPRANPQLGEGVGWSILRFGPNGCRFYDRQQKGGRQGAAIRREFTSLLGESQNIDRLRVFEHNCGRLVFQRYIFLEYFDARVKTVWYVLSMASPVATVNQFSCLHVHPVDLVLFNSRLREAPLRKLQGLFGHCPNSERPPPPSLKRALWGTLFPGRLEQMPFGLQFSLHKCPKPSWQGFRPPKNKKMPL